MSNKISTYSPLSLEDKKIFIQKKLVLLDKLDFNNLLVFILLGKEKDIAFTLEYLNRQPNLAFDAAKFLIQDKLQENFFSILKYYAARILKGLSNEIHPKLLIPILVSA